MTHKQSTDVDIRPLTLQRLDDFGTVLRGGWGSTCWCLFPRLSDAQMRSLPGTGSLGERRRQAVAELASRSHAPGLIAYECGEPVGWVAVAPRSELGRIVRSRATPPVDDQDVWVIPCITVHKSARGRRIAVALIRAAVAYAAEQGALTVEAYPRAGSARTGDGNVYFGTEPLFRRAGFHVARQPLPNRPKNWLPRLAMRATTTRP